MLFFLFLFFFKLDFANLKQNKRQITSLMGCSVLFLFLLTRDLVLYSMCVSEHVCALVGVFVLLWHEHGWFHVQAGRDEVWVV